MLINAQKRILKNGAEVILRSPTLIDAEQLLIHVRKVHYESYRNLNGPADRFDSITIDEEAKTLSDFAANPKQFMISAFFDNRIIGNISLMQMSKSFFVRMNASIGMGCEKEFCGIGLGTALINYAIENAKAIGLHRLDLTVRTYNQAGIALYEKVGFQKVGLLKDAALIDGQYNDEYLYQIIL